MNSFLLRPAALALAGALAAQIPAGGPYDCLTLRSDSHSGIQYVAANAPTIPLRPVAFTAADFAAACNGQAAVEVPPYPVWCGSLTADPQAKYIGIDASGTARSALYCQPFQIPTCGVQAASIRFSFCVDDWVGDPPADPNPVGVYLNGQPIPGFGGIGNQVTWTSTAIAPLLVGGTNQLQVYVRDNGGSIAGVMYSATICYVACRGDEVISLRSGNGSVGGPDGSIRMLVGAPFAPLPMTPANFAAAAGGLPAAIVSPSRLWCPALSADGLARWIAIDQSRTASAALFSQSFALTSCNVLSATLTFTCNVADFVGDPGGSPSVGVFVNQNPVPLSVVFGNAGTACDQVVTATIPGSWLIGNGQQNHLQVYMRDTGNAQSGVIYSATLRVRPCPPRTEVIALHSGNGTVGFPDAVIRCIDGPGGLPLSGPFTALDFSAAFNGPAAHVVSNFAWAPSIAADPQAQWVSSTFTPFTGNPGAPRSALFAQPFTVATCTGDIKRASLVIRYHADDGLGDPVGGGPDPMGIYLNGQPVPGTQGDISTWPGTNLKTISVSNVAPFLQSGGNVLYVYARDRLNAISGAMWSATITISPCDWHYFGEPCGVTVPNTFLSAAPALGSTFEYRVRGDSLDSPAFRPGFAVIGLSDQVGPGGAPLPLDLAVFGAPGCALQTSLDLSLFQILDAGGAANLAVTVPNLSGFAGLPLFFQTLMLDGVSNPLGLSATRGIAVDIRL